MPRMANQQPLSSKKIRRICSSLKMSRWTPITWKVMEREQFSHLTRLNIVIQVPDRDDGSPLQVTFQMTLMPCFSEEECLRGLHNLLQEVVTHELDEHLFYKGARLNDPHQEAA